MQKLFTLIFCLLLTACASEPEPRSEQFQDGTLKDFGTRGPRNRYGIDKNIYLYVAYDKPAALEDNPSIIPGCSVRVFNLKKDSVLTTLPEDQLLHYLNYLDTPSGANWLDDGSSQPKYYFRSSNHKDSIRSLWFKREDLSADIFNPFHVDLAEFYQDQNIRQSPTKDDFDECLQFFYDGAEKQTYTQKYHLHLVEKYREEVSGQYTKPDFEAVLQDQDTLVNIFAFGCDGSMVLFLNVRRKLMILVSSGRTKSPNPYCS